MSDNSKLNRHKYSIRVDLDCSVCGVNGLDESCEDCQGEGKYWVTQLIPRDVLDTITQDAIALNATSSDNSKLIEALECAKYAIENPDSNQDFAVWAIDHALNTATSSERVSISRECAEDIIGALNYADEHDPEFCHGMSRNELKAALEQSHE